MIIPHKSLQEYFTVKLISSLEDNLKKEVYEFRFNTPNGLFKMAAGSIIWDLCLELDEFAFTKYFLIVSLDNVINSLCNIDTKTKNKQFIEIIGFSLEYEIYGGEPHLITVYHGGYNLLSLLKFLDVDIDLTEMLKLIADIVYNKKHREFTINLLGESGLDSSERLELIDYFENFADDLENSRFPEIIDSITNRVIDRKKHLEDILLQSEQNFSDLI